MQEKAKTDSQLHAIIPPEIINDPFYELIRRLAQSAPISTVLEIGSSSGEGSTKAWVEGLRGNPRRPQLFCMEVSRARCEALKSRWEPEGFVECFLGSSVTVDRFPQEAEVRRFLETVQGPLNAYPVDQVLGWLRADINYIRSEGVSTGGILEIKRNHGITRFDAVLIDGSEFTGSAELDDVYGAEFILLDDILTFKCHEAHHRLLADPAYELIVENTKVRHGFSAFRRRRRAVFDPLPPDLPVHFFTIVLDGEPFIRHHIEVLRQLPFRWHWHIVEGVSALKHDTAWSVAMGGSLPESFASGGLSSDGTSCYLDELHAAHPQEVSVYRKPDGALWDGKVEMVGEPLRHIFEEALLWEIDADELWTVEQLERGRDMFLGDPARRAAFFWCRYFVGPDIVVSSRNCHTQNPTYEWIRAWLFRPGMRWVSHEPPRLAERQGVEGEWRDLALGPVFTHDETEARGLVFHHFAFATEKQVAFKERYYGYANAVTGWKRLQATDKFPLRLADYLPWVIDETIADKAGDQGLQPLATRSGSGDGWSFRARDLPIGAENSGHAKSLPVIVVDGVFFQHNRTGIGRVWEELLRAWGTSEARARIWLLDREGTSPEIPGIQRRRIRSASIHCPAAEAEFLERICRELGADVFVSTYYTTTVSTPSIAMVHDMIPELLGMAGSGWEWEHKRLHLASATKVAVVSESTRSDLMRFHPEIKAEQIFLARPAAPDDFRQATGPEIRSFREKHGLTGDYVLIVGERIGLRMGLHGYKNAALTFRAWSLLPSEERAGVSIFCSGGKAELEDELRNLAPGARVVTTRLDEDELRAAYSGALALAYPSIYEGFGLPVVEAMSCGCPVITSERGSLPEVGGDAVLYVSPFNPQELADVLTRLRNHHEERSEMARRGSARAAEFSYARMADIVLRALDEAANSPRSARSRGLWARLRVVEEDAEDLRAELATVRRKSRHHAGQLEKELKNLQKKQTKLKRQLEEEVFRRKHPLRRLAKKLLGGNASARSGEQAP